MKENLKTKNQIFAFSNLVNEKFVIYPESHLWFKFGVRYSKLEVENLAKLKSDSVKFLHEVKKQFNHEAGALMFRDDVVIDELKQTGNLKRPAFKTDKCFYERKN